MSEKGVVAIEFGAVWCPPCKRLLPILDELAEDYGSSASIVQVDCEESPELASSFGIMGMPTVIVFRDGQPVDKLVGLRPGAAYKSIIDRLLEEEAAEV
ncbi:thioredoxin family protein [Paenibacillus nasutitermitis]|nr:thioredoxin family protein [Paenibacillus nasutitermitis]